MQFLRILIHLALYNRKSTYTVGNFTEYFSFKLEKLLDFREVKFQSADCTSNNKTAVSLSVSEKLLQLPVPVLQNISIKIINKKKRQIFQKVIFYIIS